MFSVSEKVGASVSSSKIITFTLKLEVAVFPTVSVAVHVTVVMPARNKLPDIGIQRIGLSSPELSNALGTGYVTIAPLENEVYSVISLDAKMVGGVLSEISSQARIVTSKLAVPIFPAASRAGHVTAVTPIGKKVPDGGLHFVLSI